MSEEVASSFVSIAADLHASMKSLTEATSRALDTARMQDETIELLKTRALAAEAERDEAVELLREFAEGDWREGPIWAERVRTFLARFLAPSPTDAGD